MIPFFLSHYSYADEILVLFNDHGDPIDAPTEKLILSYTNTRIKSFDYPQTKTDYHFAIEHCNREVAKLECDWAIVVSADELVFPIGMQETRTVLNNVDGAIIYARLWWVFRHRTDKDLDPLLPAIFQRRHGCPIREGPGCIKPLIVRPSAGITFSVGGHNCSADRGKISSIKFDGAHWLKTDISIALQRQRRGQRELISERSLEAGMGSQHFDITEDEIREECDKWLDAPQLF